jgi:hypothetical protein
LPARVEERKLEDIVIEQKINEFFGDAESTGFGTGWWSGILSAFFGFLSFGAVLCLHFPQLLSSPELRPHYPMHTMRVLIQCLIVGALLFGIISSIKRKKKTLALTGMLLATAATALGGSSVQINNTLHDGPAIGLDWFLLDLLLMALIYVPLERLWPQYPKQGTFRNEWTLDMVYFMSTHLPLQILSFLVLLPATQATKYLGVPAYVRGQAYVAAGDGNKAAAEFQKLIDHPGMILNSPLGVLARLGMARAYKRAGDLEKSRLAYRDFLQIWKDADPNLVTLKQAKAEYSAIAKP